LLADALRRAATAPIAAHAFVVAAKDEGAAPEKVSSPLNRFV
jgi:hypothetical protein